MTMPVVKEEPKTLAELTAEYKRAEEAVAEARQRANSADDDLSWCQRRVEELGNKIAEIEDAEERRAKDERTKRETSEWRAVHPSSLQEALLWLSREPSYEGRRILLSEADGGAILSNCYAALWVHGQPMPESVRGERRDITETMRSNFALRASASRWRVPVANLRKATEHRVVSLFAPSLAIRLVEAYVLAVATAAGDGEVIAHVSGEIDPVVFQGTGWRAAVMPTREDVDGKLEVEARVP